MKNKINYCLLLIILSFQPPLLAQNVPLIGSFTISGQTFNCNSFISSSDNTVSLLTIDNASDPATIPESAFNSSTCTIAQNSFEMNKYSYGRNRANTLQLVGFLKTVFPLARANQLGRKRFGINVWINPGNNSILAISYRISSVGADTYITQQELAQLDALIRTSTFVFPKVSGICNNVTALSLRGLSFNFDELYVKPKFSGIDSLFD